MTTEEKLELTDKHCYGWKEDDKITCQNIVIADTEHDPFCGKECHNKYKDENYTEKPQSRFERFLKLGSKIYHE